MHKTSIDTEFSVQVACETGMLNDFDNQTLKHKLTVIYLSQIKIRKYHKHSDSYH